MPDRTAGTSVNHRRLVWHTVPNQKWTIWWRSARRQWRSHLLKLVSQRLRELARRKTLVRLVSKSGMIPAKVGFGRRRTRNSRPGKTASPGMMRKFTISAERIHLASHASILVRRSAGVGKEDCQKVTTICFSHWLCRKLNYFIGYDCCLIYRTRVNNSCCRLHTEKNPRKEYFLQKRTERNHWVPSTAEETQAATCRQLWSTTFSVCYKVPLKKGGEGKRLLLLLRHSTVNIASIDDLTMSMIEQPVTVNANTMKNKDIFLYTSKFPDVLTYM